MWSFLIWGLRVGTLSPKSSVPDSLQEYLEAVRIRYFPHCCDQIHDKKHLIGRRVYLDAQFEGSGRDTEEAFLTLGCVFRT